MEPELNQKTKSTKIKVVDVLAILAVVIFMVCPIWVKATIDDSHPAKQAPFVFKLFVVDFIPFICSVIWLNRRYVRDWEVIRKKFPISLSSPHIWLFFGGWFLLNKIAFVLFNPASLWRIK
jgi:hypothetical protein